MGSSRSAFLRKQYLSWDSRDDELSTWWRSRGNLWLPCLHQMGNSGQEKQSGWLPGTWVRWGGMFQCGKFVSTWEVLCTNLDCVNIDCSSPHKEFWAPSYETMAWKDFRVPLKDLGHWFFYSPGLQSSQIGIVNIFTQHCPCSFICTLNKDLGFAVHPIL